MLHRVINIVVYLLSGLIPRRPYRVVFGAWLGYRYADNSRYLFEYLCNTRPDLDLRWVGKVEAFPQVPEVLRKRFVSRGSLSSIWLVLTAGRVYISHGYCDLAKYNLCRGAIITYLGHGLTIKRMGAEPRPERGLIGRARKVLRWANTFDQFAVSSQEHANKLLAEYSGNGIAPDRLVYFGQPRTDPLLVPGRDEDGRRIRRVLLEKYGFSSDRRLVTFMPTFRDNNTAPFSFIRLEEAAAKALDAVLARHDAVLVEKMHFVDSVQRGILKGGRSRRIVALGSDMSLDTQDLLLATDILITDYSGCYLDYLHLDRPVLHFVYDLEFYTTADRGMYYSLEKVAGGAVARDLDELVGYLDAHLADPSLDRERRKALREWMLHCDDSRSCKRFAAGLEI